MDQKKSRPLHPPESYLSKVFVMNEGLFDFGPILIGKDAEKRHSDDNRIKVANSAKLRITNNGSYDALVTFALSSTLQGEELPPGKSPFIIEPETMNLKVDQTEELTLWAFPDEA